MVRNIARVLEVGGSCHEKIVSMEFIHFEYNIQAHVVLEYCSVSDSCCSLLRLVKIRVLIGCASIFESVPIAAASAHSIVLWRLQLCLNSCHIFSPTLAAVSASRRFSSTYPTRPSATSDPLLAISQMLCDIRFVRLSISLTGRRD